MFKTAAIVGHGPSAAFAWKAARDAGFDTSLFVGGKNLTAEAVRNGHQRISGAFWVHKVPPDYSAGGSPIDLVPVGQRNGYLEKQWGTFHRDWPSSFPAVRGVMNGFNPREVIPWLWEGLEDNHIVGGVETSVDYITSYLPILFDAVIVTTSVYALHILGEKSYQQCFRPMSILWNDIGKEPDADGVEAIGLNPWALKGHGSYRDSFVIYSGEPDQPWVRLSRLWGKWSIETTTRMLEEHLGWYRALGCWDHVTTITDIPPWIKPPALPVPRKVLLTGRWATINRSSLSHDSYRETRMFLNGLGRSSDVEEGRAIPS